MLHPLIVTLTPWLPTHTAPMDIVSISVTSCMPPKCESRARQPEQTHTRVGHGGENVERVILSTTTAGLLEE